LFPAWGGDRRPLLTWHATRSVVGMSSVLDVLRGYPVRTFAPGAAVLEQGERTGLLYVLVSGAVAVLKDDVEVARVSDPGAIFGDLSALLDGPHTATVRALRESAFHLVVEPRTFLLQHPAVALQLCELLARRLDSLNKYLVDVRHQFAGDGHLGMVDDVLDTLMHRQPRKRIPPKPSALDAP